MTAHPRLPFSKRPDARTYIVPAGETLDESTEVVEIKPKQVAPLTDGEKQTLRLKPLF